MEEVSKGIIIVDLKDIEWSLRRRTSKPKPTTKKPEQLFPVEVKPRRPLGVHSTTSFCSEHDLKVDVLGNCAKCK
jgi:KaiC/GvpD/RAD55 family RecA-like ATPase